MKLSLVRHGQTDENKHNIVQGQGCGMLNNVGLKQAKLLAEYLKDIPIDLIYCSDMQRAMDTLEPALKYLKCPVHYRIELREKSFGIFEMKPAHIYYKVVAENGLSKTTFCPEGGESFIQMKMRISKFWDFLKSTYVFNRNQDTHVLCMTHGGTVRCFLALLDIMTIEDTLLTTINNTSITTIYFDSDYQIESCDINNVTHLPIELRT